MIDKEKAVEALVYIASKFPGVGRFHAAKILYFAELGHLREYGRPIVGDRYIAMDNGPVPSFAYDVLKGTVHPDDKPIVEGALRPASAARYPTYNAGRVANLDFFSPTDIECLDAAIAHCRQRSFGEISDETHKHPAWTRAAENGPIDYSDMLDGADPDIVEDAKLFSQYGVF